MAGVQAASERATASTDLPDSADKTLHEQVFAVLTLQRMSQLKPFFDCKFVTCDSEVLCARSTLASASRVLRCEARTTLPTLLL